MSSVRRWAWVAMSVRKLLPLLPLLPSVAARLSRCCCQMSARRPDLQRQTGRLGWCCHRHRYTRMCHTSVS